MSIVRPSSLKKWVPSDKDFSHHKRFEQLYGATTPVFPTTLGRPRRAILDQEPLFPSECTDFQAAVRAGYKFNKDFSRKWHGAKESEIMNALIVNGADPRSDLKVPLAFGALPVEFEPATMQTDNAQFYLTWQNWPNLIDKNATPYFETAYNLVDGPYDHFDNIRFVLQQAYAEGQTVLVFSSWYSEWNQSRGIAVIPKSQPVAEHASLFIDFMNADNEPALINHLSQGTDFGDQGFLYFPRETVNWLVESSNMGCYIFRNHPSQTALLQAIQDLEGEALDLAQRVLMALAKK